jgi:hypothetical protein
MDYAHSLVCVLGAGRLAAAVRVRLRQMMPPAPDVDCDNNWNAPALFLACSDFENTALRRALGDRARVDRSELLFASLLGNSARVGPLITSYSRENLSSRHLTRSWDFSRSDIRNNDSEWSGALLTHTADRVTHLAQIGAMFVVRELTNLLFGAEGTRLVERVTKIDSPTDFCQMAAQGLPEVAEGGWMRQVARSFERRVVSGSASGVDGGLHTALGGGTLVAGCEGWREICRLPARGWHPAGITETDFGSGGRRG